MSEWNHKDPLWQALFFAACSFVGSVAGLAKLLRSGENLTWRNILSAILNSGVAALTVGLIGWHQFNVSLDKVWILLGVAALAGVGGASLLEFTLEHLKRKYFPEDDEDENDGD